MLPGASIVRRSLRPYSGLIGKSMRLISHVCHRPKKGGGGMATLCHPWNQSTLQYQTPYPGIFLSPRTASKANISTVPVSTVRSLTGRLPGTAKLGTSRALLERNYVHIWLFQNLLSFTQGLGSSPCRKGTHMLMRGR